MNRKGLAIVVLVVIILFLLFSGKKSGYASPMAGVMGMNVTAGPVLGGGAAQTTMMMPAPLSMGDNIGQTVSSASLIPRDVVATEDFGQFSPDKTLGGVLRNANRDFRSEPLNPRTPVSIFNLSTIPPDVMRPKFEIEREYQ